MSDPDRRVCPECGEPGGDQPFCASCGTNLSKLDRLPTRAEFDEKHTRQEAAVRNREQAARADAEQQAKQAERLRPWLIGLAATLAVAVVAAVLILPVGPSVSATDLETSLRAIVDREAPPASGQGSGVKSLICEHGTFDTGSWDCELRQDVSGLPDARVVYDVDINDDGRCYSGRVTEDAGDDSLLPTGALLPQTVSGCVGEQQAARTQTSMATPPSDPPVETGPEDRVRAGLERAGFEVEPDEAGSDPGVIAAFTVDDVNVVVYDSPSRAAQAAVEIRDAVAPRGDRLAIEDGGSVVVYRGQTRPVGEAERDEVRRVFEAATGG